MLLVAAILLLTVQPLYADEPPLQVRSIAVGFQGHFKVGEWTPLRLQIESKSAAKVRVIIEANDADDYVAITEVERSLTAGAQQVQTCFRTARLEGLITVRLVGSQGELLYRNVLHPGSGKLQKGWKADRRLRLVAGLSRDSDGLATATESDSAKDSWLPLDSFESLPTELRGYESVDALLLTTSGSESQLKSLTGARNDALRQWVAQGGHLIVSVGSTAGTFSALPLASWLPVTLRGQHELRQLPGLESYLGKNMAIRLTGTVTAARLPDLRGPELLASELDGPIVVRVPYGFGRVTVLGIDLDTKTIPDAQTRHDLMNRLGASARPVLATQVTQAVGRLANVGVTDLATQLQGAQEEFAGSERIPYWGVMGLIMLYIVVLGPIDYLIVHRWLRRPHLTWITFPLVVLIATFGSIWAAGKQNGSELKLNQFTLVDLDAATGTERGSSWCTLLSPHTQRYTINVQPVASSGWQAEKGSTTSSATAGDKSTGAAGSGTISDTHVTWVGVPENTVGGLYRSGGLNSTGRIYHLTDGPLVPDLPVQQWSTKTVLAQWTNREPQLAESHLESTGPGRLRGSVVHKFPVALEDCLLMFGGRVYFSNRNRRLTPFQEWEPAGPQGQQRDLRGYLTGTEASRQKAQTGHFGDEIVVKSKPYDPNASDRFDLLRMLTFHQAAGGKTYTGLDHASLGRLEMTDLMDSGRAVLIGRVSRGSSGPGVQAAVVSVDDAASLPGARETFVRIVFPVKQVVSETPDGPPGSNQP